MKKTKNNIMKKVKKNPWIISTFIVSILMLIFAFGIISPTGSISANDAGENFVKFVNANYPSEIELVSAENYGDSLYEVIVLSEGNEMPAYVTSDGKYFVQIVAPLDEEDSETATPSETAPSEVQPAIPKTDKPSVELFIMSHCPYGTQAEKGMIPAARELGDSIDFNIRFVYYAMHGEKEITEQLNQYCIQEEQRDLYLDYLECFLDAEDSEGCLTSTGVDVDKMNTCVEAADTEFKITESFEDKSSWLNGRFPLFNVHADLNDLYGIGGSPSLIINGEDSSAGRNAASYMSAICDAFTDKPEVCETITVSSTNPSPGFGYDASGSDTTASCN